jgi:hypothetical protein
LAGEIHTVHRDGKWLNEIAGGDRASNSFTTKEDAVAEGRRIAQDREVEHLIHNVDGQIHERHSYGNDPRNVPG